MILSPGTLVRVNWRLNLADKDLPADTGRLSTYCPADSILTIVGSKTTEKWMAYLVLFGTQVFRTGYDFHHNGDYLNSSSNIFAMLARP